MPDRISHHNAVRLVIHWPTVGLVATWTLTTVATRKGVPHAQFVARGRFPIASAAPTEREIWQALSDLVESEGTH